MLVLLAAVVGLLGWGVWAGIRVERRVLPLLIRQARGRPWRGALAALGLQLGALAGFAVASLVAVLIGQLGGRPLVVVLESVVLLAYVPVLMTALPGELTGYRPARDDLERAGANRGVARAIAWSGGPVAFLGLACVIGALFALVDPA